MSDKSESHQRGTSGAWGRVNSAVAYGTLAEPGLTSELSSRHD